MNWSKRFSNLNEFVKKILKSSIEFIKKNHKCYNEFIKKTQNVIINSSKTVLLMNCLKRLFINQSKNSQILWICQKDYYNEIIKKTHKCVNVLKSLKSFTELVKINESIRMNHKSFNELSQKDSQMC